MQEEMLGAQQALNRCQAAHAKASTDLEAAGATHQAQQQHAQSLEDAMEKAINEASAGTELVTFATCWLLSPLP